MVAHLPETSIGHRDKALLLTGFAGAMRRSEIVAHNVGDLDDCDEGLRVTLRRSKTDQEAKGRQIVLPYGTDPQTYPVRDLQGWLDEADIARRAIFRPVDRHANIATGRLTGRSVANIVKRAAQRAGLDPAQFSGHSRQRRHEARTVTSTSGTNTGLPGVDG